LAVALGDPTTIADILARRSANFRFIGNPEEAFRDAFRAVSLLDRVSDTDARHQSYGTAADAAELLGNPLVALYYRNAAVETIQRAVVNARAKELSARKHHLAIALRTRAETLIALGRSSEAEEDLQQGADLSEAIEKPEDRDELRMYLREVRGQKLLADAPAEAAAWFTEAIKLAKNADSTYRATLFFERAAAWRKAHNPRADADIASASELLRNEVRSALTRDPSSASKPLWDPYFSRFRDRFDELIESRITADDKEGAFVQAELARAFEPMQILLPVRPIETTADLRRLRALPEDTVILQFLVLPQRTYTWVITREKIQLVTQAVEKSKIERWVTNALDAIASLQSRPFENATRAAYGELFRTPLKIAGPSKTRVVIVPDGPMHGLPFNALGSNEEGYLIKRASISVAGSTSLYLYALTRDRQLAANAHPSVVLVADPPSKEFPPLPAARQEVSDLARDDYPGAEVLTGAGATVANFLKAAKHATILHFAGHSVANPQFPWQSRLLLAADGEASGELTAQKLMQELPSLPRTRLVVLGACSTAGGGSVGPQGLAPLVRPFIAANVPAVVGALWDVRDASAKRLLVSLHCHYRHGDDVAVALRQAQLERLRDNDPATAWAAFQVAGYAASPYPRSPALEDPSIEHLCTANSLLGPDGLHSQ
ncbi:MAG TPA: CHAT domain-containing protein, partial [Thermoanaerobaculia bacterium]|nr:CHAT domain-containing protein [Thermoanaerobaculia bacterium]